MGLACRCINILLLIVIVPVVDAVDFTTLRHKVLFGYQGWFDCPNGSSSGGSWSHFARGGVPSASTLAVDLYPDLSEFSAHDLCHAGSMTIQNKPAYLFSSKNPQIVLKHFEWMQTYNLDGVLLQRFVSDIPGKRSDGDKVLRNIMTAVSQTGRTFAIEYDVTNSKNTIAAIKEDWAYLVDTMKVTSHPNYLKHNGKPLLSVWGVGFSDSQHPPTDPAEALALIQYLKHGASSKYQVTYMGGVDGKDWSKVQGWTEVFKTMDVIQPWTVGRYDSVQGANEYVNSYTKPDLERVKSFGNEYMPVIFPGFSWFNLHNGPKNQIPRLAGAFLKAQADNVHAAGATMLKIAMFDEINEGTAMFKAASLRKEAPDQGYWLTLDADSHILPSDFYLRMAGNITAAFHSNA